MKIIICGAGQVGSQAAQVLAADGHDITLIDTDASRLRAIADTMDVATYAGNCAQADVLREAGPAAIGTTKRWLNELDGSLDDAVFDRAADLSADVIAGAEAQARLRRAFSS